MKILNDDIYKKWKKYEKKDGEEVARYDFAVDNVPSTIYGIKGEGFLSENHRMEMETDDFEIYGCIVRNGFKLDIMVPASMAESFQTATDVDIRSIINKN